eukprot:CAMPEP_0182518772 /NCGR_PEP_ID=MMETSP1321-20130603/44748_1 /TAXON_ID=91990 /ORGANISM="Bolidomonas sp., Strain RCC1657" /LENGTH=431 /DNA_ID=CAMNT_0024726713 /DNA_START=17 /DNA_END=1312 /DNA_ORIENTATION=-
MTKKKKSLQPYPQKSGYGSIPMDSGMDDLEAAFDGKIDNDFSKVSVARNRRLGLSVLMLGLLMMFGLMAGTGHESYGVNLMGAGINDTDVTVSDDGMADAPAPADTVADDDDDDDAPAPVGDDDDSADADADADVPAPAPVEEKKHHHHHHDTPAPAPVEDDDDTAKDDDDAPAPVGDDDDSADADADVPAPAPVEEKKHHHHHHDSDHDHDHDHDSDHDHDHDSGSKSSGGMAIMSCLEMPSMCQGYMIPAVRDFSNPSTKEALRCIESEGSNMTESASCLEPAVNEELDAKEADPNAKTNVFDLMQCAVCMHCIDNTTVDPDIMSEFNCSNVHPSGNWNGDWHQYVGPQANGGGDSGYGGQPEQQQQPSGSGDSSSSSSSGGFDWSIYLPENNEPASDNKSDAGADAGAGAGAGGGFDWTQFLPGHGGN